LQQVRYTEGYPYLLALAVVLWLAPTPRRPRAIHSLFVLVLLLPGCTARIEDDGEAVFQAKFDEGSKRQQFAAELADADPLAERSLLVDAREEFLRAALLRHGDTETAGRITTITRRLRELDTVIQQQRAEEAKRSEKLAVMIQRLEKLAVRQMRLSERSQRILRDQPVPAGEYANLPETEQGLSQKQLGRLAPPIAAEQQAVQEGTKSVLHVVTLQRDALREFLTAAYGKTNKLPPTEVDPIVDLLAESVAAQDQAIAGLAPDAVDLPRANTALRTAAGRMEQAVDGLRGLQPPKTDAEEDAGPPRKAGDYDEEIEGGDSEAQDTRPKPISPGDFQEALSLESLPTPDYTPAEILAEEAANQQKRAQRKAAWAGSRVEKNW
jgi:hypothetical protein